MASRSTIHLVQTSVVVGVVGHADEDGAAYGPHVDGHEAVLGLVEVVRHVGGPGQAAVQAVGPAVVGADQPLHGAARGVHQLGPAVAAGVVEGAQRALVVAHDQDGGAADVHGHVLAWRRHLAFRGDEQPFAVEHCFQVRLEQRGVRVEGAGKAVVAGPGPQHVQDFGGLGAGVEAHGAAPGGR